MTRLVLAFAALLLAAVLAAVGYVLLRLRWRWEPDADRYLPVYDECCEYACYEDPGCACSGCAPFPSPRQPTPEAARRGWAARWAGG